MQLAAGEVPREHLSAPSTFPTGTFVSSLSQPALDSASPRVPSSPSLHPCTPFPTGPLLELPPQLEPGGPGGATPLPHRADNKHEPLLPTAPCNFRNYSQLTGTLETESSWGGRRSEATPANSGCTQPC